jgi:hypothetical protein
MCDIVDVYKGRRDIPPQKICWLTGSISIRDIHHRIRTQGSLNPVQFKTVFTPNALMDDGVDNRLTVGDAGSA